MTAARKQPGRRYGPPPSSSPHPEMQAPEPMTYGARATVYAQQPGGPTARQAKHMRHMAELHGELIRLGSKAVATPKRKKVHRDAR